jgi:hypothetical protein
MGFRKITRDKRRLKKRPRNESDQVWPLELWRRSY